MTLIVLAVILSYLAGSIPVAYLVVKAALGQDIRTLGSGNAGATNAMRVLGALPALGVAMLDFLKGFLPVFLTGRYLASLNTPESSDWQAGALPLILAGSAAIAGHIFPVFSRFRGGKGVATGAGVLTALVAPLFLVGLGVFGLGLVLSRRASVASLMAAFSAPLGYAGICALSGSDLDPALFGFTLGIPVLVVISHRKNIKKLFKGQEPGLF